MDYKQTGRYIRSLSAWSLL